MYTDAEMVNNFYYHRFLNIQFNSMLNVRIDSRPIQIIPIVVFPRMGMGLKGIQFCSQLIPKTDQVNKLRKTESVSIPPQNKAKGTEQNRLRPEISAHGILPFQFEYR